MERSMLTYVLIVRVFQKALFPIKFVKNVFLSKYFKDEKGPLLDLLFSKDLFSATRGPFSRSLYYISIVPGGLG